ncbi:hypothetical protein BGZ97_008386, partial [Linnemannia gamsii]
MKLQLSTLLLFAVAALRIEPTNALLADGHFAIQNVANKGQALTVASSGNEVVCSTDYDPQLRPPSQKWSLTTEKDEAGSEFRVIQNEGTGTYFGMDENYRFVVSGRKFFWVIVDDNGSYRIHDKPTLKSTWVEPSDPSNGAKLKLGLYADDDKQ